MSNIISNFYSHLKKTSEKDFETSYNSTEINLIKRLERDRRSDFITTHMIYKNARKAYMAWLEGYLNIEGREFTHFYDYEFQEDSLSSRGTWFIAKSNFVLDQNLCGASAINIIVPKGIEYSINSRGHCNIYRMEDYTMQGTWVPFYSDFVDYQKLYEHYIKVNPFIEYK